MALDYLSLLLYEKTKMKKRLGIAHLKKPLEIVLLLMRWNLLMVMKAMTRSDVVPNMVVSDGKTLTSTLTASSSGMHWSVSMSADK